MVHLMALHLVGLSVGLVQAFQFLVSNRHYGAVARMEVHANGIVYDFEILQIGAFRKLILAFHIYIVHQDVLVRTYQREDAGTFYSFFRLLLIIFRFCPLSGSQGGGGCLFNSIAVSFRFIEQVVKSVFINDVSVNTGFAILRKEQSFGFSLYIGEIFVGVCVINNVRAIAMLH